MLAILEHRAFLVSDADGFHSLEIPKIDVQGLCYIALFLRARRTRSVRSRYDDRWTHIIAEHSKSVFDGFWSLVCKRIIWSMELILYKSDGHSRNSSASFYSLGRLPLWMRRPAKRHLRHSFYDLDKWSKLHRRSSDQVSRWLSGYVER